MRANFLRSLGALTQSVTRFPLLSALGLVAVVAGGACAASGNGRSSFTGASSGSGNGGSSSSTASANGGGFGFGGMGPGAGTSGGGDGTGGACAAQPYEAQELPLDMYILQDQSGSMGEMDPDGTTKWQAVTQALTTFVQQSGLTSISVGIQYFGLRPGSPACGTTCTTDADCGPSACGPCVSGSCAGQSATAPDSCTSADYATPDVEIAPLPGVAGTIVQSLSNHSPSTSTPTGPALQGAVDHAKAWATSHPDHVVIAVLATDGAPSECNPMDQAGIAQIAATALAGTPSIKTFAIGTFAWADYPFGPALLDAVAAAGGTGQAFNINTTQNVNQAFLDALNSIRSVLACQYAIPEPTTGAPDYGKVNVQYTPGGGTPTELPQYPDPAHCPASGDGWYYDNDQKPTQIMLCPSTCTEVNADAMGKINILLGCQTKQPS